MRKQLVVTCAALLLASVAVARAQTPPTKPAPPDVPSQGLLDVGVRFGDVDGDEARFERYRDLRPGAATLLDWTKRTDQFRFNFGASNIGYRDQRYAADYDTGTLQVSGVYDSIPLNYLYDAPYWFTGDGNGNLVAFDASKGAILWHTRIGNISNSPQTYMMDGRQVLLVASGATLYAFHIY